MRTEAPVHLCTRRDATDARALPSRAALAEVDDCWVEVVQDMSVQYAARAAWMDALWVAHGGDADWVAAPRPLLFSMSGAARSLQSYVDATEAATLRMEAAAAAAALAASGAAPALAAAAAW